MILDLPEDTPFRSMALNIETGIFGKIGLASVVNGEVSTDTGSGPRTFDWWNTMKHRGLMNVDAQIK